jgi:hypothetical protein
MDSNGFHLFACCCLRYLIAFVCFACRFLFALLGSFTFAFAWLLLFALLGYFFFALVAVVACFTCVSS